MPASAVIAADASAARSSLDRPARISNRRVPLTLRATTWRMAVLALSAACTSSTTTIRGLSSPAAVTAFRNASASRNGVTSAAQSTGLGTPGKMLKISGVMRASSLNTSGSALLIARCTASWRTSSLSTELRGEAPVDLQRIGAVAGPGPRLHEAADGVLRQGIEIVKRLRVALDRREVADATPGVHLPDQAVAHPGRQLGAPFVLPLL